MRIIYQGLDISQYMLVRRCIYHDCVGRADVLELELEKAEVWDRWHPAEDDTIKVTHNGYDSGKLYVNTVSMEDTHYKIYATSLPCRALRKEYFTYKAMSLKDIMASCAARAGLDWRIYGLDETIQIPYVTQNGEGIAAFLQRVLMMEGAVFKVVSGRLTAIGIEYAQQLSPARTVALSAGQRHMQYMRFGKKYKSLTVMAPYFSVSAEDTAVTDGLSETWGLPVSNVLQAGRWARGLLLYKNLKRESLTMDTTFDPFLTAMARLNVTGGTQADGRWIVYDATHDIYNGKTSVILHRCVETVK